MKLLLVLFLTITSTLLAQTPAKGPLVISANKRYFSSGDGKPIYMVGSHNWQVLQDRSDLPAFNYTEYLNFLRREGHNFFRMWYYDTPRAYVIRPPFFDLSPLPFNRSINDPTKYDLDSYNEEFFTRLHDRCLQAQKAGIYADVMLSGAWWPYLPPLPPASGNAWSFGYWNPINNTSGYFLAYTDCYTTNASAVWASKMRALMHKMIAAVNDLDNVVFEVTNEGQRNTFEWQKLVIQDVHEYERRLPKQHLVGFTAGPGFQTNETDNATYLGSDADWVSLSGNPYANPGTEVPPDPVIKPDMLDTDHIWGIGSDTPPNRSPTVDYLWRGFTRGHNHWYMDPYGQFDDPAGSDPGHHSQPEINHAMGQIKALADRCALINMTPISPTSTFCSTHYALIQHGHEYVAYKNGETSGSAIRISFPSGKTYIYEWIDPISGAVVETGSRAVSVGDNTFEAPASLSSSSVLHLYDSRPIELRSVVSRKTHGSSNEDYYNVSLPLSGSYGIECRSGGPNAAHQLIFTFNNPLAPTNNPSVSVEGTANVAAPIVSGRTITVDLTGVADVQVLTLTLSNVKDILNQTLPSTSVRMGMLLGDTNHNGVVNATDVAETKSHSGNETGAWNFRADTSLTGFVSSTDIAQVKANSGHEL